jgi:HSP20 family protein
MRLTVWDPFRDFANLRRASNRLYRNPQYQRQTAYPPLEMVDTGESVTITAEVPGVNKEEVELIVLGDTLTIAGEKKLPAAEGVTYVRHERPHGKFRRLINLPYSVAQDKIKASYREGILTITLPKAEEAKPRQISLE